MTHPSSLFIAFAKLWTVLRRVIITILVFIYKASRKVLDIILWTFFRWILDIKKVRSTLYHATQYRIPGERATIRLIEKKMLTLQNAGKPMWDEECAVIYDIRRRLQVNTKQPDAFVTHYTKTLAALARVQEQKHFDLLIEYGSGPGILGEAMAKQAKEGVRTMGLGQHQETLEYNKHMAPHVTWDFVDAWPDIASKQKPHSVCLVLDGVPDAMSPSELGYVLTNPAVGGVVLYYSHPIHYEVEPIVAATGMRYDYLNFMPPAPGTPPTAVWWGFHR